MDKGLAHLHEIAVKHSRRVHRVKSTLEVVCFTAVAGGVHAVEAIVSGGLAVIIVCMILAGEEA